MTADDLPPAYAVRQRRYRAGGLPPRRPDQRFVPARGGVPGPRTVAAKNTKQQVWTVSQGGTGDSSLVPFAVLCGGTSAVNPVQQVSGLGSSPQVLTSNGAGALPSWQPAGAGLSADRDVWLSGLFLPTGLGYTVLAETIPRPLCSNTMSLTSGTPRIWAIPLPTGKTVAQMTVTVGTTIEAGGTHGWYALLDNTGKVLAVTADQTGAAVWSPANAAITIPFGASVVTSYRGLYYLAVCVTATTPPTLNAYAQGANTGALALTPALGGLGAAAQNTPPAVGATVAISAVSLTGFWASVG